MKERLLAKNLPKPKAIDPVREEVRKLIYVGTVLHLQDLRYPTIEARRLAKEALRKGENS